MRGVIFKGVNRSEKLFRFTCHGGQFNYIWENSDGRLWIFPPGTRIYATDILIETSTDAQPNVQLPIGGGDVILKCKNFTGNWNYGRGMTRDAYVGNLADTIPTNNNIGDSDTKVKGNIRDIPRVINNIGLSDCPNIGGDLSHLWPVSGVLSIRANNLPVNRNIKGAYTAVYDNNVPNTIDFSTTGMSVEDVDKTLIALSRCTKRGGDIRLIGLKRSSASDNALIRLTSLAWTIYGVTKV